MLQHGSFLANRWEDEGRGFFAEVGVDDGRGQAVVLRSFIEAEPLEDYSYDVRLPEL